MHSCLASTWFRADADVETSKRRLYEAMNALRNNAVKETDTENPETGHAKPVELERVARFTAFLDASEYRFDEIETVRQQGKLKEAVRMLSKYSEEEIDGKFQPMIDAAIDSERERAKLAREKLKSLVDRLHWVAILSSTLAGLFSIVALNVLVRGVKKPIEALLHGTDEIAAGNLSYRISLNTRDEFGYLATHLNHMAQELEFQQQKLREGRAILEKKVTERTRDLHQLNGELQRMDAARREFLADISHELRTPITVIRGEAEVTLRGRDREIEEYKDTLQRIVELAMQLNKYVADLLFLARTENTNLQFEWEDLDFSDLVSSAFDDIQVMALEHSIVVVLDAARTPLCVRGDKQRLLQVLFILGDNACRYSGSNTQITIKLWSEDNQAYLIISDQGIGIPASDLELVFDRYYRSQNTRGARDDGTGLGLPIARSILKAHDGKISAASAEGEGTTFTVTLPLASKPLN